MTSEVLIIGGGLAGAAAGIRLARAGRDVVLVEREAAAHDKVCGEFLSQEALSDLDELGVDVAALGAVPIDAVRLCGAGGQTITVALPFAAMSLTRRRMDEELLSHAAEAGVRVLRGVRAETLDLLNGVWTAQLAGSCEAESVAATKVLLATGKHDFRGHARSAPRHSATLIAFKMYFALDSAQQAALARHVELVLYSGGYGGLQMVEGGAANLCCLIERAEFARLGSRWELLLEAMCAQSAHLRERLEGATPLLSRPLALSAIPYGFVRAVALPGLYAVGDQAAVIPSFTGDGMSIALHTARLAAEAMLRGETSEQFQFDAKSALRSQVRFAARISQMLLKHPQWVVGAARLWPGVLRQVASRTRIAPRGASQC
jgi:flavin-dependent dehydrogenase